MSVHIVVRKITGTDLQLTVDPTKTVAEVKELISASGKGKLVRVPGLTFKGHELRDTRCLKDYEIGDRAVVQIIPPSPVPKISLQFEKEDGDRFTLSVFANLNVYQLKSEIQIEVKVDVKRLTIIRTEEDSYGDEVVITKDLEDEAVLSSLSLEDETIYTSTRNPTSGPVKFGVLLAVDERFQYGKKDTLDIEVQSDQTLGTFKEQVLTKYAVALWDYTLIFVDRELKDDQQTLHGLGFTSNSMIHAVANIQFSVVTPGGEEFMLAASPMTRLSGIRKMLQDVDTEGIDWDGYQFSLNGMDNLRDTRTLWDLDVLSGVNFSLRPVHEITISIRRASSFRLGDPSSGSPMFDITTHEEDTIEGITEIIRQEWPNFESTNRLEVRYRCKQLAGSRTLKEEGLVNGDILDVYMWSRGPDQ